MGWGSSGEGGSRLALDGLSSTGFTRVRVTSLLDRLISLEGAAGLPTTVVARRGTCSCKSDNSKGSHRSNSLWSKKALQVKGSHFGVKRFSLWSKKALTLE